ncbi:MAG: hypothetical protein JXM70_28445 [Pirellulales bacterium]|nr:hypothetical protein [Pirellulales bacterium]
MSHDLKQSFTMIIGFALGFAMASVFVPSNLALTLTTGVVCGILAGAFYAQVSYGDVFWHMGESIVSVTGSKQLSTHSNTSTESTERSKYSDAKSKAENRSENQTGKSADKNRSTSSFSTSRFRVMSTGSNAKHKKSLQKEKSYWISHQRSQTFIPGRQEQQGRRYQRRVKPREGLRIDS